MSLNIVYCSGSFMSCPDGEQVLPEHGEHIHMSGSAGSYGERVCVNFAIESTEVNGTDIMPDFQRNP